MSARGEWEVKLRRVGIWKLTKRFLSKGTLLLLPKPTSTPKSTPISKELSSKTPVFDEPGVVEQTPFSSIDYLSARILKNKMKCVPNLAVSVADTFGISTPKVKSAWPISVISIPKVSFGFENAATVTEADRDLTSKIGVTGTLLKPVAELDSGFEMSAVTLAESARPASRPKSMMPCPWNELVTPTVYTIIAPSLNIPATSIPASGMGKLNSSRSNSSFSGAVPAVMFASSCNLAETCSGEASTIKSCNLKWWTWEMKSVPIKKLE